MNVCMYLFDVCMCMCIMYMYVCMYVYAYVGTYIQCI